MRSKANSRGLIKHYRRLAFSKPLDYLTPIRCQNAVRSRGLKKRTKTNPAIKPEIKQPNNYPLCFSLNIYVFHSLLVTYFKITYLHFHVYFHFCVSLFSSFCHSTLECKLPFSPICSFKLLMNAKSGFHRANILRSIHLM